MSRSSHVARRLGAASLALTIASSAWAEERTICVYDPLGTNGPAYKAADSMRVEAKAKFDVDIVLKAHVEEKTASDDLVAGKCDGAAVTGIAARSFGLASATIEAIGALPTYSLLKTTIGYLADDRMNSMMVSGDYETAGIFPAGAVYLYVRNQDWRSANDLAGKKISVIRGDAAAETMVKEVGSSVVGASTATFGPMFNSGSVDAAYAPATAYEPLELYRGITNGGIIDLPLSQLTLQLVIKKDRWPEGFGSWGRKFAKSKFDDSKRIIDRAEAKVNDKRLSIPDADKPGYAERFLKVRLKLRDSGTYNSKVLGLMRRVRCAADGSRSECAEKRE